MKKGILIIVATSWVIINSQVQLPDERKQLEGKERGERTFWEIPRYPRPGQLLDWGGWLRSNFYLDSLPPIENARLYSIDELKFWFNIDFKGKIKCDGVKKCDEDALDRSSHILYGRFQERFTFFDNEGDSLGSPTTDWRGPDVDIFYYRLNIPFQKPGANFNLVVGRKYFYLGEGLTLFNKLDGIEVGLRFSQYISLNTFLAKTIRTTDDFDYLRPRHSLSDRFFLGAQISTSVFPKNPVEIYYLQQLDRNPDKFTNPAQDFLYDSWYLGFRSTGKLLLPELIYSFEFVWEGGRSSSRNVKGATSSINAWANIVKLEYVPNKFISRIFLSNFWGSGDADRVSPRTSALGSAPGTTDTALGYFGFVPTGLAFFPYLSNIILTKGGFILKPFYDETSSLKDLSIGLTFY
ncbi:MAG: hypothetical protein ACK4NF_06730, partial [Planctomycetota bacterium]